MEVAIVINEETIRKLREMNLGEIVVALESQKQDSNCIALSFDEKFQRIVDCLYQERYNSKIQRLIKNAKFRLPKAEVNSIYYSGRNLDQNKLSELSTCQFINSNLNLIIQGFTGSGKTFLACALGKQACKVKIKTRYIRLPDLLIEHEEARITAKSYEKFMKKFSNFGLLILDEWLFMDISDEEQHFLFELIERRHDFVPTIFCTQYRREDWHSRLGGGVHADAIMDRIVHNAVWLESGTMNMREYCAKNHL
jgi:DNA replication protein DnaC